MTTLPEMVRIYHEALGVSIEVPRDWHGQMFEEARFRVLGPEEPDFDRYRATMDYVRGRSDSSGEAGLEALFRRSGEEMQARYAGFQLERDDRIQAGDAPGHVRYYRWRDPETGLRFSQLQALILERGGALYLVNAATLTALESLYMPVFDAILRSTRFVPAPASA